MNAIGERASAKRVNTGPAMPIPTPEFTCSAAAHGAVYTGLMLASDARNIDVLIFSAGLAICLIWFSVIDLRTFRLPDLGNLALAGLGFAATLWFQPGSIWIHLAGALAWYGVFWALSEGFYRLRGHHGLGLGDAKLMAAGALWIGPFSGISVLLLASLGGILAILLRSIFQQDHGTAKPIPFGPFLCISIWIIWLFGPILMG